jgi:dihydroorotate dehydrogenase (NAD+) catalytic subunit
MFEFKSPICLSACSLSDMKSAPHVGAIFIKSVTLNPQKGNQGRITESVKGGLINRAGLPNSGLREFCRREIYQYTEYRNDYGVKLIPSIHAQDFQEMFELATVLNYEISDLIDGIELNLSCPNATQQSLKGVIRAIKQVVDLPLIVKLAPEVNQVRQWVLQVEEEGADAVTLTNSAPSAAIVDGRVFCGGLSGKALKPISLRCVYEARQVVSVPIFGCGGIDSIQDVIDYQVAGASYFQVGSAEMLKPGTAYEIVELLKC